MQLLHNKSKKYKKCQKYFQTYAYKTTKLEHSKTFTGKMLRIEVDAMFSLGQASNNYR